MCLPLLSCRNQSICKPRSVTIWKFYNARLSLSLSVTFFLIAFIASHRCILSALHFSPIASFDLCSPGLSLLISCSPSAFLFLFSCLSCVLFHYLMSFSWCLSNKQPPIDAYTPSGCSLPTVSSLQTPFPRPFSILNFHPHKVL